MSFSSLRHGHQPTGITQQCVPATVTCSMPVSAICHLGSLLAFVCAWLVNNNLHSHGGRRDPATSASSTHRPQQSNGHTDWL